jgi:uridine phosphorylase
MQVVRDEGMTQAYVPASYPAAASHELVLALITAAEALNAPYHVGISRSSDSDFCGVGRPGVGGYMQPWNTEVIEVFARAGVLIGDRESAAVFCRRSSGGAADRSARWLTTS